MRTSIQPVCLLAMMPVLFWNAGLGTAPALKRAGIEQIAVPAEQVAEWKRQGFGAEALSEESLRKRALLTTPGIDRRVNVASATTAPWVNANGWHFRRGAGREFRYDLPLGTAALAAAEAYAYGANAVLKINASDLDSLGSMLRFLRSVPERSLPEVADFGFIDDGSPSAAEQMNLLSRRNLLYKVVRTDDPALRLNVKANSDNPQLFAAKVREHLIDEQRSFRVYGSEVVLCRLMGDGRQARVHLLNYGRRKLEEVRLRVRGSYTHNKVYAPEDDKPLADATVADGFTEFSVRDLGAYAVVDLLP